MERPIAFAFNKMQAAHGTKNTNWALYVSNLQGPVALIPITIFCLILISNITTLLVFMRFKCLKIQHKLMIGLAVSELLAMLPYSAMVVTVTAGSIWLMDFLCSLLGIMNVVMIVNTVWIHTLICVEKCFSALYPVKHRNIANTSSCNRLIAGIICLTFLVDAVIFAIALLTGGVELGFQPYPSTCSHNYVNVKHFYIFLFWFIIPTLTQWTAHALVYRKIKTLRGIRRKSVANARKTIILMIGLY